ncbi:alpha/beta fold hydrolase [Jiella sonneratiae]|uniref:Alpha/beta hydrolase n=1 Tax=Jiella sonneratiae TaxID=2816856 RepID=A0ABS3IYM4_9HYPH|nr:alpha/beta hydrolase [Jiella sonneratiae]MBO0902507.1 alpha/beta hydrolase [Jiella sonneratiae]
MPVIETKDGVEIFAKDWGEGRPFVLVHGWPLNADMWDHVANELVEHGFRVVAYDRRGFGRSGQPGAGYDYDTLSDDLAAVIDGLGLSDVTLVGFSMGGGEVARYMSRHGGRQVTHAALVSAVTPYLLKDDSNPDGVPPATFDGFVDELKKDRPGFLETFGKQFYGVGMLDWSVSSAYLEWTKQMALQASLRATIKCVDAFGRTDFRADMGSFEVPTLVVHGTSDSTVPFDISGKRAAGMIRSSELVAYDGAPHGLHYTEQDRLVRDLVDFAR